ncbi:hypothetical protein PHYPSEUDO_004110 [Phytophthora pseudosyringae]|uniref:Myb-like domain-containing protein n=1 Tax=Phytophthora pseudosyringae TaxID=221518 RepID=A0A8T1WGB8_9STRA|nr:hypothetical protein PHYPSEUDO_004110 [Phytophthora pseudosyringae]
MAHLFINLLTAPRAMISKKVHDELMSVRRVLQYLPVSPSTEYGWTPHERQLFWVALDRFPRGPWTAIAEFIGTKSTRQAMTHGQKMRQKLQRWVTRLQRNPNARSLMDGATVTPTSSFSTSTDTNVAVSTPRSLAVASVTPSGHGHSSARKQSTSNTIPDGDGLCVVVDDKHEGIRRGQNEEFNGKSCSDSISVQVESTQASSSSRAFGYSGCASITNLQMLFEPHAPTPAPAFPAAAPIGFGETKHNEVCTAPYPIDEAQVPGRNLLDELADALWNDHVGERNGSSS